MKQGFLGDMKINLFILGAAKCGTTSLYQYLSHHPSILMARPKEPLFFEAEFEHGVNYYHEKYFSHWSGQTVVGDARHRNLYLPFVVKRIKDYVSDEVKFLVILRNPVDRAYSHWWHNYSWGDEKRSFESAIEANLKRLESGPFFESEKEALLYKDTLNFKTGYSPYLSYIDSGFYAEQLKRYIDVFGVEKIKVLFLDDLIAEPQSVMQNVFEFIGINSDIAIYLNHQNAANSVLGKKIIRSLKNIPGRKMLPEHLRSSVYQFIRKNFRASKRKHSFSDTLREDLIEIYEPHILRLERMVERNLDTWRGGF